MTHITKRELLPSRARSSLFPPLFTSLCILLSACGPRALCTPQQTRCVGSFVEVCDADGRWRSTEDCAAIITEGSRPWEGAWKCCSVPADELGPEGHSCVPPELTCDGGGVR